MGWDGNGVGIMESGMWKLEIGNWEMELGMGCGNGL